MYLRPVSPAVCWTWSTAEGSTTVRSRQARMCSDGGGMRNRFATILASLALLPGVSGAQPPPDRISLDWIWSDEGKSAAALPEHAWLQTGQVVLYDKRLPKGERLLESYDPATGLRKSLVDVPHALASITAASGLQKAPDELGWPDTIDPQGRWAAYEKDDALVVLDLRSGDAVHVGPPGARGKSARFSPDGRKLAFVRDNDLYAYELETRREQRLTTGGSATLLNGTVSWVYWEEVFGRVDLGYWWSPDSSALAYLQTDESGVSVSRFVDFEPATPRVIEQRYPKTGEPNPRVRAGVVSLATARTTWVDLGAFPYEYLVRVQWLPDAKRLAVQTLDRQQTDLDVYLAEAATGSVRHLFRETDPGWVNLNDDLRFLKTRSEFLWVSERDGYAHFYLYGLDGHLIRQVTKGPWAIRASARVSWLRQAGAALDEKEGWLYFSALEKSATEGHLYRIHLDGTRMERLSKEDGVHKISFSPDGRYYLDANSASDRLPGLSLHQADGSLVKSVAEPRPETLARFDLRPRELFTIPARDGFALPAMLLRPRGFDPNRRYPIVLYVYGGPSAPTVSRSWDGSARGYYEHILSDEGFGVLHVDNRASTAQSKRLENLILRNGSGSVELNDLLDAVKWLKAQSWVDPERVGIWGWSGGASYTLLAMTSSTEFRAGIAVAPVTDWRYYDTKWAERYMKRPEDNPEGYLKTSHAARAKNLHGRLMLVHGTYDDNVHPQNTWRFTDEL